MKRPVFIIIGIVLVVILMGVWVYFLFFGSPTNGDSNIFSDLDLGDTTDTSVVINDTDSTDGDKPTVDTNSPQRLKQLTTKPIVGHQEILRDASSTPEVAYIEAGTGNIFSIDLESGEEARLSGTTIKDSVAGAITPNGQYAMIQSGWGANKEFFVGKIDRANESIDKFELKENIVSFQAASDNTFLYAVQTGNAVVGKHYYPISDVADTIFTIPFREAGIVWGDTALSNHYAYPKASSKLEGFVYQIDEGDLTRLPIDGFGLSATGNDSLVLYSKQAGESYATFIYDIKEETTSPFLFDIIPEKCTSLLESSSIVCAGEALTDYGSTFPDVWYQGRTASVDVIREIGLGDFGSLGTSLLVDIKAESGREVDAINLGVNMDNSNLYFINKNDQTLWLLDLTIVPEAPNSESEAE